MEVINVSNLMNQIANIVFVYQDMERLSAIKSYTGHSSRNMPTVYMHKKCDDSTIWNRIYVVQKYEVFIKSSFIHW